MQDVKTSAKKLTLAHSPDSDDMVMWWPLTGMRGPDGHVVEGSLGAPQLDTLGFAFETVPADIQELNRLAMRVADPVDDAIGYDITAISAHAYPHVKSAFAITSCGASIGEAYGPKVVVRADSGIESIEQLRDMMRGPTPPRIAVPGKQTTAFLALSILLGGSGNAPINAIEMLFSDIIGAVQAGAADVGVLIHEAQLTYADEGLKCLADLGSWWHAERKSVLPLGLNVIKRDLDDRFGTGTCDAINTLLTDSIRYAMAHLDDSKAFLRLHAEGRPEWHDDALLDRYLGMYVSDSTFNMGADGVRALDGLLGRGHELGLCPDPAPLDVLGV